MPIGPRRMTNPVFGLPPVDDHGDAGSRFAAGPSGRLAGIESLARPWNR